jgi:ABC-2 type transport system permease protein
MTLEFWAIVWKEWRELVFHPASRHGTLANLAVLVAILGVLLPAQRGAPWLESGIYIAYWAWVPTLLVSTLIADSFAGERERHTLETLLASRLSDDAVLFGKIAAAVIYGWSVTLSILLVGVLVVNLMHWTGAIAFYHASLAGAVVGLSFLLSLTTASAGALASIGAATVRQAQTTLNLTIAAIFLVPALGLQLLADDARDRLLQSLTGSDPGLILWVTMVALLLLNVGLLAVVSARFQRTRLLLD